MSVDGRITSVEGSGVAFGGRDSKAGGRSARWHEKKRYLWMLGLLAPASALLPSQLVYWTGMPLFWWSGVLVFFVIIPIIDLIAGEDGHNPDASASEKLQNDRYYRWCTYLFLPMHFVALGTALGGADRLQSFLGLTHGWLVRTAEWGLVIALALHMALGLRVLAIEWLAYRERSAIFISGCVAGSAALGLLFLLSGA